MATTKPIKDKPLAPAPKLKPRPTASSIARAALNANRTPPQQQRPAAAKPPTSPVAKRKQNVRRSSPDTETKADTHTDTKIQEISETVTSMDPKPDDVNMNIEEKFEENVRHRDRSAVLEDLQEEIQLETDATLDYSEPLIDSIEMASTPSISQPQTPAASRPQTPKSGSRAHPSSAAGSRPNTPRSTLGSARPSTPVSRPATPRILAQPSPTPQSTPQEPVMTSKDISELDDDDIKTVYSAKQKQFLQMKKELDMKQQAVLEAFDSLRALRERMPEAESGGGEGAAQELLVFNVADWPAEELAQLYRDTAITDTDGALQLIDSIPLDEFNFNEVETKVVKIPEQFADLCLQAFTARQELIDWIKDLLLHSDNDCGEGETLQKIANYNSQGIQLCDALRELKDQADNAVDSVSYLSKRVWRDQNALVSVGKVLVRDIARLKQDLETQASVINEMQQCRLQADNNSLEEIRQELEEERSAKNMLKDKLALSESQHRKTRIRVTKMDKQLREAEASIATLTGTVKVLEDQSRQREAQLEARARKMRESLKTGEVASGHLAQKRDALQAEVTELKEEMEKLSAQYNSNIKKLENQLKETKSALEEQNQLIHKKNMELATARETAFAESKATIEQLTARITELENNTTHDDQKLANVREMELMAQLQATKEALRSLEEEVVVYKQEKVRFLETLSKIANAEDKVGMQQKLAAELLSKEEIIGKMQVQMRELSRNDKLLEQKVVRYEQYINDLQAQRNGATDLENSNDPNFQEFQKEILDLKMKVLEEAHRNEELAEALAQKEHQIEQQDKTSRAQARVIKVREELINMLKNKETEQTRELLALQKDLENRMSIVDEVNKQIAAKALEIQELFTTLETKQQQIHRLEKIVLALEEQQRRAQAQRTRHEEKIATLERELAASCRRERSQSHQLYLLKAIVQVQSTKHEKITTFEHVDCCRVIEELLKNVSGW